MIGIIPGIVLFLLIISSVASLNQSGEIIIEPFNFTGDIAPLLGVNAGPAPVGDPGNPDITDQYHDIGVLSIRNHDIYNVHSMSLMYPDRI